MMKHPTDRWKWLTRDFDLVLMALPGALFILLFNYLPMYGIVLAFKNFKYNLGIMGSPWVGLDNFRFLFMTDSAWRITRNTLGMNALFITFGLAASVGIAMMLYEISRKLAVKTYQSLMIFPRMFSWVVVGYMFYGIMNPQYGLLNNALEALGMQRIDWYSKPEIWPSILVLTHLWKEAGMGSVIYYATLMGIDKEYFEAAAMDGATKWQITRHIKLPFLLPVITLLTILSIGNIIRADFGMFYTLTRDVATLYSTTDVIDTFVFRSLRKLGDTGMAAAAGLYQSVVGFILIVATNAVVRKIRPEDSLY